MPPWRVRQGRQASPARPIPSTGKGNGKRISPPTHRGKSSWYVYSQEDLTYILGYPDKTVHGEWNLTRAETAAIFYRLHAGAFPAPKRQMSSTTFRDVPQNAWYYKELEMCYNLELANGTDGNRFAPDSPITRAEFAAFAARFAQLENSGKALFNDVTPDHWAYQAVNAAAEAGWIKGYPDGSFKPDDFITRAEAVSLINRMRNRVITAEELKALGIANPYTDLVETYWAYGDLLEATIKHSAADWHKLNFTDGMDQVTYDGASRTLTVELGEIAPDEEKTVTFRAVVNSTAYNKSFQNMAVLTSENAPDVTVKDGGTVIGDGFVPAVS